MGKALLAFIVTIIVGYAGLWIDFSFGIIFSIATIGAFIIHSIENKNN